MLKEYLVCTNPLIDLKFEIQMQMHDAFMSLANDIQHTSAQAQIHHTSGAYI